MHSTGKTIESTPRPESYVLAPSSSQQAADNKQQHLHLPLVAEQHGTMSFCSERQSASVGAYCQQPAGCEGLAVNISCTGLSLLIGA